MAWTSVATSGFVIARHAAATGARCVHADIGNLARGGMAQRNAASGRPRTRSGAATTISTSCWAMCAEKRMPPSPSSGETRAMTSESQPA